MSFETSVVVPVVHFGEKTKTRDRVLRGARGSGPRKVEKKRKSKTTATAPIACEEAPPGNIAFFIFSS
jgi:hypothetical protein